MLTLRRRIIIVHLMRATWTAVVVGGVVVVVVGHSLENDLHALHLMRAPPRAWPADTEGELRRVYSFLGVSQPAKVKASKFVKSQTGSLRDKILNYDEVERTLRGTRWDLDLEP